MTVSEDNNEDDNADEDGTEETCQLSSNSSVLPINIQKRQAICSESYILDIHVRDDSTESFRTAYIGNPRTLRTRLGRQLFNLYVNFNNKRIAMYRARELVIRAPSEHSIDGQFLAGEAQFNFILDKRFRKYTKNERITLSVLLEGENGINDTNFFTNLVDQLRKTPYQEILNSTDTNYIPYNENGLSSFNTYFARPIRFWAYNGTTTASNCDNEVLRIILKQRLKVQNEDLLYYQSYLKNLTETETNARRELNPNSIKVYSCGESCYDFLTEYIYFALLYSLLLYFLFYLI